MFPFSGMFSVSEAEADLRAPLASETQLIDIVDADLPTHTPWTPCAATCSGRSIRRKCRHDAMRLLIAVPFLVVLVIFVLSNRGPGDDWVLADGRAMGMPLSVAVLIAAAAALVVGAVMVWISELRQRRRAHHAEVTVRRLEEQVANSAQLPPPKMSAPKKRLRADPRAHGPGG